MTGRGLPLHPVTSRRRDLTRWPLLGRYLRWKHARTAAQIVTLLFAGLIILDGFIGPSLAPRNLAGVLPWVHWRGLVVLALLIAGNLFCFACPFMLPRRLAKRLLPANRPWPRWIPGKWLALAVLVVFFWAYEAFDLWASPWLTAWVAVAYFAGAFVVDGFFRGAAFCKHVCPIGQFNMVNSLASPVEVRVREPATCAECQTKDCIRGHYDSTNGKLLQQGCELWLFQERKAGNMDCTFCLDCVQACPYDNVGVIARSPAREFSTDPVRSGLGRLSQRTDIALLSLVLVFGAFVNAFGMVSPVFRFQRWLAGTLGISSEAAIVGLIFLAGLVILPLGITLALSHLSRLFGASSDRSLSEVFCRFSLALVPLGFGMWVAHYGFHFLTGALTIIPVMHSFLIDIGVPVPGEPDWSLAAVLPISTLDWFELIALELGLLGALGTLWLTSRDIFPRRAVAAMIPWMVLAGILFVIGIWLMTQPMEMRGTVLG